MSLLTYDPKQVTLIVGVVPVTGFISGSFIKVSYNETAFKLSMGVYGEGSRAKNNNQSGKFVFSLQQTAASNGLLTAQHLIDFNSVNGLAVPILLKDLSGASIFSCECGWCEKIADVTYANEIQGYEWSFETDKLISVPGGNLL